MGVWDFLKRLFNHQVNAELPPHVRWPEILHYQKGDQFDRLYGKASGCSAALIQLNADGSALCWDHSTCREHKERIAVSWLVGHNTSLQDRQINEELKQGAEYAEMIAAFNEAFEELQNRTIKE